MRVVLLALLIPFSFTLFAQRNKDSLIVFIGEKIEVRKMTDQDKTAFIPDIKEGYVASYRILKLINGHYSADTITFHAYDHDGMPAFSNYDHGLLFVYPNGYGYLHTKYTFYPVYKTKNEKWAGVYAAGDYQNNYFKDKITVNPEKIDFSDKLSFDLAKVTSEMKEYYYPAPFFTIRNNKAVPVYGNYVEDLFRIRQQTILKVLGFRY